MKTITKTISLEPFTSRIPNILTAYEDGELKVYDEESLKHDFNGNYGSIPLTVEIPSNIASNIKEQTDIFINVYDDNGTILEYGKDYIYEKDDNGLYRIKLSNGTYKYYATYRTLVNWYHAFNTYYDANRGSLCGFNSKYEYSYVSSEKMAEMALKCENLGGKKTFDWMCENIFKRFEIDEKWRDAWGCNYLYLPEVFKWRAWFNECFKKYNGLKSCKNSSDCCECEEYNKRGGSEMRTKLNGVKANGVFDVIDGCVNIPLCITNTIENVGEFTVLAEKWEGGVDYSSKKYNGGRVVNYNGDTYINTSNGKGYKVDDIYKEFLFNEEDWTPYIKFDESIRANDDAKRTLTGYTESKLFNLADIVTQSDDAGNKLPYFFQITHSDLDNVILPNTPNEGSLMDILFHIGNTSNIKKVDADDISLFFGDILTDIVFYYKRIDGGKDESTVVFSQGDNVAAINECNEKKNNSNEAHIDTLYADFIYYIGAYIVKDTTTKKPTLASNGFTRGVKHTDTVRLELKDGIYDAQDVKIPVKYYELQYDKILSKNDEFDEGRLVDASVFEFDIPIVESDGSINPTFTDEKFFETYNGFTSSPVFREEYRFANSGRQYVKGNIYIDRGSSQSVVPHLQLMEIKSLEALENYKNGSITIKSNKN